VKAQRRTLLAAGAVATVAVVAGVGTGIWRARVEEHDIAAARALFALTLPDAAGAPQPLAQWEGRPLLVNFWATWCAPCVEEMPDLQRFREEYRGRGVEVIGLGIDSPARIRQFRDDHKITLPLLVAGVEGSSIGDQLGNTAGVLPYTVLIGANGRVLERKMGRVRPDELRRWLGPATPRQG
jgi:thiol-disulfide isomerase/thioredoxin